MEKDQMIEGLISIITPVYNSRDYLEDTILSVISQDYGCWELILVNDGSSDDSGDICDRFVEKDNRISVFHTPNKGVSHARNIGIKQSKGEYIVFLDSDDLLSPLFLSSLLQVMKETEADIVRCGMRPIDERVRSFQEGDCTYKWETFEGHKMVTIPEFMFHVVWGKIFRASLIKENQILFAESLSRGEDTLFAVQTTLCALRVLYSENKYVNYRIRANSLMRSKPLVSLYEQSVDKYYKILGLPIDQIRNPELWTRCKKDSLVCISENIAASIVDKSLFAEVFKQFCEDKFLQDSIKGIFKFLNKRLKFVISLILLLNNPRNVHFVWRILRLI